MSNQSLQNGSIGQNGELKKGLKARHLTMISLGGSIGTGLFWAAVFLFIQQALVAPCLPILLLA